MEAIIRKQKRRTYKKQMNKLSSSVHEVMSNDDLLIEILHNLPVTSLLVSESVCKHWLSLIRDPFFAQCQSQLKIDPPSGLFLEKNVTGLVSLDSGVEYLLRDHFLCESIIEQSCNGLLLCGIVPDELYVYNPTTDMFKMLPEQHGVEYDPFSEIGSIRLAFDPTKSPHYKVVHAGLINDEVIQIQIYSSETCSWSDHGDQFPSSSFDCFNDGIYWNGSINWLNELDEHQLLHFKLDISDHPVLTTMEKLEIMERVHGKLLESRGYLLYVGTEVYSPPSFANVYEMRNESSGWSLRYVVDFDNISIFPKSLLACRKMVQKIVWWVVLEENEEDSYMIIRFDGKVVKYNMASESICVIFYLHPNCHSPEQFIPSYAQV